MVKTTIKVGNAPCSWGTLEFEGMQGERIGYEQMLDELVETGYTGTELGDWGYMPTDPETLRRELEKRELTMLGAFIGLWLKYPQYHAQAQAKVLEIARLLAAVSRDLPAAQKPFVVLADDNGANPMRTLNAGRVKPAMSFNEYEWQTLAQGLERVARAVREETGLRSVFHHHCAGFVETPAEVARLLESTDPALLGLVFDTGHYAFGAGSEGCDKVLDGLDRFAERIWYVHFKDCDSAVAARSRAEKWDYFQALQRGLFCELGQGCIDFPAVLAWLRERNYNGYILVEQDILPGMGAPEESARRNREYLKSIGV